MFSSIPIESPTSAAIQNEVKFANSAAVRAGTTWSGSAVESSWVIDAASTPRAPATMVAATVLMRASWFGASPISIAPTSFSEAARVASPNLLNLKKRERASVAKRMIAGRIKRSTGTIAPSSLTVLVGSTVGCGWVPIPKASDTAACATSSTPSDAASLASGEAVRNGRKAANSIRTPIPIIARKVMKSATAVGACQPPSSPDLSDQYAYPASIAIAPVARLMIPEPR